MRVLVLDPWGVNGPSKYLNGLVYGLSESAEVYLFTNYYFKKTTNASFQVHNIFFKLSEKMKNGMARKLIRGAEYIIGYLKIFCFLKKMKEFDELTIQDDFMFYKVMQNKELCGKIIQTLLGNKIGKIVELTPQNIIKNTYSSKGVRLDVLAKDEDQKLYNIEMQMMNEHYIIFRLRYYQASIDISSLEAGQGYDELPNVIIVFLCNKDPLGYNLPLYTLKNYCLQTNSVVDDGTTHIIINYSLYELIEDEELRAFCRYCKTKEITSKLTEEVDYMINNIKQSELAKQEYTFLFNRYPDDIQLAMKEGLQKGIKEGREKGILTTARRMKENNFDIPTIAKITGLSKQEIERL